MKKAVTNWRKVKQVIVALRREIARLQRLLR